VERFRNAREAKEYLIGCIFAQAKMDGVELSEIERKMLYFSETGWTLPDMKEASAEFDRDYDEAKYEDKVEQLIRSLRACQDEFAERAWLNAVTVLSSEDHYLLVLINAAQETTPAPRPPGDLRRLIFTAAAVVVALAGVGFLAASWKLTDSAARYLIFATMVVLLSALLYFRVVRLR
jgi:hypothetical protein